MKALKAIIQFTAVLGGFCLISFLVGMQAQRVHDYNTMRDVQFSVVYTVGTNTSVSMLGPEWGTTTAGKQTNMITLITREQAASVSAC